jgi:hypothetical protein
MMKMVLGGAGTAVVLAGFILAIVALAGSLKQGQKRGKGLAIAGLGINGVLLLLPVLLLPALMRVARAQNAGYTVEEMMAMPQVIPGSRVILNEPLGFRIEIPGEFVDNPQPKSPRMLYSFLYVDMKGTATCINIERLGGWIRQETVGSEFYAGLRSQLPPDAQIERAPVSWKTHQLDAFGTQFSMGGRTLCAWVVQVPLSREAIQVGVGGPVESGEECHQLLNQLLAGLEGRSNWDPSSAPMTRTMSSWSGPRVSHAAASVSPVLPAAPAVPATPAPVAAAPIVAAGHSDIRTLPGAAPKIPERNSKLIYEFDLSLEPVLIHVPASYDGSMPFGLIDDPMMDHVTCGAHALRQALNFIEPGGTP